MGRQFGVQNNIAARVWDAKSGKELAVLKSSSEVGNGREAAFSPDGRGVVLSGWGGTACIWIPDTGKQLLLKGHNPAMGIEAVAFSPDGARVVTASGDRTARVWNATTGKEIAVLKGHQGGVTFVSWRPDGRWIVTLGNDKTARIWNAVDLRPGSIAQPKTTGLRRWITGLRQPKASAFQSRDAAPFKEFLTLRWSGHEFHQAAISADGRRVLTQTPNGARLWPIDVLELAKKRTPRQLMGEEWERYRLWEPADARSFAVEAPAP
jgi:WD40 repeat protein